MATRAHHGKFSFVCRLIRVTCENWMSTSHADTPRDDRRGKSFAEGLRCIEVKKYPWDGVSGVRPFSRLAEGTTVGVY
jgi:hypothetical protein